MIIAQSDEAGAAPLGIAGVFRQENDQGRQALPCGGRQDVELHLEAGPVGRAGDDPDITGPERVFVDIGRMQIAIDALLLDHGADVPTMGIDGQNVAIGTNPVSIGAVA